jgi:hypothetical protein
MQISRSTKAVCGVVLAAAVIGFTNPKAVHAVTAAFVQVTNTASNPVVTQGVGAQAGNMVHVSCTVSLNLDNYSCTQMLADGSQVSNFGTPNGESLVITSVDVAPVGGLCPGSYETYINESPDFRNYSEIMRLTTPETLVTTPRTVVGGGSISGGGGSAWQRACVTNYEKAQAACDKTGVNVTACVSAAQAREQTCQEAGANSAQQRGQPGTITTDPYGGPTPSSSSCGLFLTQNSAYCAGLSKSGASLYQACQAKVLEADNSCKADAAKASPVK